MWGSSQNIKLLLLHVVICLYMIQSQPFIKIVYAQDVVTDINTNLIQKIEVKKEAQLLSIEIISSKSPSFNVFKHTDPVRLMIDIANADVQHLQMPMLLQQKPVENINAIQLKEDNRLIARIIIELSEDAIHFVKTKGDHLLIEFPLTSKAMPKVADAQETTIEQAQAQEQAQSEALAEDSTDSKSSTVHNQPSPPPSLDEVIAQLQEDDDQTATHQTATHQTATHQTATHQTATHQAATNQANEFVRLVEVQDIRFEQNAQYSAIKVLLSGDTEVGLEENERQPVIVIKNAQIPSALVKRLDTRDYEGPIAFVSSFQAQPREVHLLIDLKRVAQYDIKVKDHWVIFKAYQNRPSTSVYEEQGLSQAIEASNVIQKDPFDIPKVKKRTKKYTGKKMSINIKDADIHNVIRSIAKVSGTNIVMSDEISGSLSIVLDQVPWDQALEIILKSKGLDYEKDGNIIRVAPRETIAAERKADIERNQIKEKLKPVMIRLITVNHADGVAMVEQVKNVLSERGTVNFDQRTNTLIIKDVDVNIDAAEDLVRRLDTQTPQVLIEARIVEVNKVNEREFGIQWGGQMLQSTGLGNPTGLYFPSAVGIKGGADDLQVRPKGVPDTPNFIVNLPATVGVGSGGALGLTLGSVDSAFNLNVRLSAAATRGTVKIISSPKITTLDNKLAIISQGVSIPISQISAQGVQTTFFDATLKLEVTPHVTQDGNIYLQLKANNDTPDFQNVGSRGDPTILKKQASTQVLLKDGETTVIGGIYTSNSGTATVEFPILGQIPIIGVLFRNDSSRSQRNELLIFITPRVVNRTASQVNTQ